MILNQQIHRLPQQPPSHFIIRMEFINYNNPNPVWPKFPTSALGNADPDRANVRITQFHGTPMGVYQHQHQVTIPEQRN